MARKVLAQAMYTSLYDLSKMTKYELREYLAPVRDAVHKRVQAIKKAGVPSPALKSLESSGGLLSSKGADKKMLISEIQRGKAFLNLKTSRMPGARKYLEDIQKKKSDAERVGVNKKLEEIAPDYTKLTDRNKGRFWETLHKLKQDGFQLSPEQYDTYNSLVRTAFKGKNPAQKFLDTIPAEAKNYIMSVSDINESEADELKKDLEDFLVKKSAMGNDALVEKHKLHKGDLDSYWSEKIAKMIEAYDEWLKDHPEFR